MNRNFLPGRNLSLYSGPEIPDEKKRVVIVEEEGIETAWWKCDEGSGTTLADSAGTNNLTLANGSWTADTGRGTKPTWNKSTTTARNTSPSGCDAYTGNAITVTAWIYPKTVGEGNSGFIASNYMSSGTVPTSGWLAYLNIPTLTKCQFNTIIFMSGDYAFTASGPEVLLNTWNHIAFTYKPTGDYLIDIYRNGEDMFKDSIQAGEGTILNDTTNGVSIGCEVETSDYVFDGYIDDVRIYQQKLTAEQIAEIYDDTK